MRPEGDKSDHRNYQVPADIADEKITDNTTLRIGINQPTGKGEPGWRILCQHERDSPKNIISLNL